MVADQSRVGELTRYVFDQVLAGRRDLLERILAEEFVEGGTIEIADREDWLHSMLDRTTWESINVRDETVVLSFDHAVVTSARVMPSGTRNGEPFSGIWQVIDVWHRTGVDWRLLTRTVFPAN